MQYSYQDIFSPAQKSFWIYWFWCLLVLLLFFVSPLLWRQNVSLWGLFWSRTPKKNCLGWDRVKSEGGHGGHAGFGQKLLNTQHSVGRHTCKSPIMKWANTLKESLKTTHRSRTQPLTIPPACTLIQVYHPPSKGSLYCIQGAHQCFSPSLSPSLPFSLKINK